MSASGAILSLFYLHRDDNANVVVNEQIDRDFEQLRNGFIALLGGSFVLFGIKVVRPITGTDKLLGYKSFARITVGVIFANNHFVWKRPKCSG